MSAAEAPIAAAPVPGSRRREPAHRRTGNPVRRGSRLAGAEPWRRIGWRAFDKGHRALKRAVVEEKHARPGKKLPVSAGVLVAVYDYLGRLAANHQGRVEPSIKGMAQILGHTTRTIVRALAWLKAHRWLDWMRRMVRVDGGTALRGPAMRQITNAYWLQDVPPEALALLPAQARVPAPVPEDFEADRAARAQAIRDFDLDPRAPSPLGAALLKLRQAVTERAPPSRPDGDVP